VVWLWQGHVYVPKTFLHVHHKASIWVVLVQFQIIPVGRKGDQYMPTMRVQEGDIKTPYPMY
jgi:hypothetical protein